MLSSLVEYQKTYDCLGSQLIIESDWWEGESRYEISDKLCDLHPIECQERSIEQHLENQL